MVSVVNLGTWTVAPGLPSEKEQCSVVFTHNTCACIGSIGRETRSSECVRGLYEDVLGSSWKTSYAENLCGALSLVNIFRRLFSAGVFARLGR